MHLKPQIWAFYRFDQWSVARVLQDHTKIEQLISPNLQAWLAHPCLHPRLRNIPLRPSLKVWRLHNVKCTDFEIFIGVREEGGDLIGLKSAPWKADLLKYPLSCCLCRLLVHQNDSIIVKYNMTNKSYCGSTAVIYWQPQNYQIGAPNAIADIKKKK